LVYVSATVRLWSEVELGGLLARARAKNGRLGVTGLLVYQDGNVMQALEGPERIVEALAREIERDPRHRLFQRLTVESLERRLFGSWSMAYHRIVDDGSPVDGFSRFLDLPSDDPHWPPAPSAASVLLQSFRRTM
jgi:hypothetical protein